MKAKEDFGVNGATPNLDKLLSADKPKKKRGRPAKTKKEDTVPLKLEKATGLVKTTETIQGLQTTLETLAVMIEEALEDIKRIL